jgi:tRNA pseudouridine13 synthase
MTLPVWAHAHGLPLFSATLRSTPEDFDVTEELGFDFDGEGEHDYLYVEKTGANTEWVSRQLAGIADVPAKDVGYSGMKDRHAVTRQWFSVPRWNLPDWNNVDILGVCILETHRHSRKLRRGAHKANLFRIVMRGELPDSDVLQSRFATIRDFGVPNYFGPQRFGRGGGNLNLAAAWSSGKRLPRHKRSIAISTARSFLFNEALHTRVLDKSWNEIRSGEVANLDGTGSVFDVDSVDNTLIDRCAEMDIHPTGVLWGDGADRNAVAKGHEDWLDALIKGRVKFAHRSLRLRVSDIRWTTEDDSMTVEFRLGRGAYATSVLREIASVIDT